MNFRSENRLQVAGSGDGCITVADYGDSIAITQDNVGLEKDVVCILRGDVPRLIEALAHLISKD